MKSKRWVLVVAIVLVSVTAVGWLAIYGPAPRFTCVGEVAVGTRSAPVEWHGIAKPEMTLDDARQQAAAASCAVLCDELNPSQAGQGNADLNHQVDEQVTACRERCDRDANLRCHRWTDWVGRDWIRQGQSNSAGTRPLSESQAPRASPASPIEPSRTGCTHD